MTDEHFEETIKALRGVSADAKVYGSVAQSLREADLRIRQVIVIFREREFVDLFGFDSVMFGFLPLPLHGHGRAEYVKICRV